jgi:hypothetical protein
LENENLKGQLDATKNVLGQLLIGMLYWPKTLPYKVTTMNNIRGKTI